MSVLQGSEYYISKRVGRAIMDYKMLSEGDRIAVAVSGGKDSLALLRVLDDRRAFVPIRYSVVAIHIDLGYPRSCAAKLEKYFKKIGVEYRIEKVDALRKTRRDKINCFWCSWNRRRMSRIISELKKICPDVKTNIFRSVQRIKKEYLL